MRQRQSTALPTLILVGVIIFIVLAMPITLIAAPPSQSGASALITPSATFAPTSTPDLNEFRERDTGILRLGYSTIPLPDNSLQVGIVVARQPNGDVDVYYLTKEGRGNKVGYFGKDLFFPCKPNTVCADLTDPNTLWRGVATRTVDGDLVLFQIFSDTGKLSAQFVMFYSSLTR